MLERGNHELVVAKARVRDAAGDLTVAGQPPNPSLAVGTTLFQTPSGQGGGLDDRLRNYTDYNVGISVPVERGGKRELRKSVAGKGLDAARADVDALRLGLRNQLVQIYYDLALAEHKEALAREYAELYDKSVALMRLRYQSGDIAAMEVSRIEMESEQAAIQAAASRSERRALQTTFATLLGLSGDAEKLHVAVTWDWDAPPAAAAPQQVDTDALLQRRPDILAARLRVEQAQQAIKLAESLRSADLAVGTTFDHQPPGNSIARNNISFNISIPLQVRYQYRGEISKAYAELDMAEAELERVRSTAANEMQQAADLLSMKSDQIQRLYSGVAARARTGVQAAEFAYRHGASSLTDLLDARRTLQALLIDVGAARAEYAKAIALWRIALGEEPVSP